jgi:hypothetical protein
MTWVKRTACRVGVSIFVGKSDTPTLALRAFPPRKGEG